MIRVWAVIANKLGISQEQALLLAALLKGWLNVIARRQAILIVGEIVERFQLDDNDWQKTYGEQLYDKGILNKTEAELFSGNYNEEARKTDTSPSDRGPAATPPGGGFDGKS